MKVSKSLTCLILSIITAEHAVNCQLEIRNISSSDPIVKILLTEEEQILFGRWKPLAGQEETTYNITNVVVGKQSRKQLGDKLSEELEQMAASPDRPEHFIREYKSSEPLNWISKEEKNDIIHYAHVANIAYCNIGEITGWNCGSRCIKASQVTPLHCFQSDTADIFGYVGVCEERREIYVSFRGSRTRSNWLNNLYTSMRALPWKYPSFGMASNPYVHEGFAIGYESISSQLIQLMLKVVFAFKEHTIVTMGHSLGGCLATLFALEFNEILANSRKVNLITFEAPRIGDESFAKLVQNQFSGIDGKGKSIRVTHGNDLVVHLPPYIFGFRHAPTEYFIPPNDYITGKPPRSALNCHPQTGEDPRCSANYLGYSIDDHLYYPSSWDHLGFGSVCSLKEENHSE